MRPILKQAELLQLNLYSLRHTCATLLLAAGVNPKIVSERLGHASPMITMTVYQHVMPGMQRDAANRLAAMVLGS